MIREAIHERIAEEVVRQDAAGRDAFVALPGGIGTLEEVVEMLSWRRLDLHKKPVVFLSEDDFWAPFFHLIEHTVSAKLTPPDFAAALLHANSVEACFETLERATIPA